MLSIRTMGATALLVGGFGLAAQAAIPVGLVQDPAGKPLAHVYVRQEGSLTSSFTDEQGKFRLFLDPRIGSRLVLSAPDYQPIEVDAEHLGAPLTLQPSRVVTVPEAGTTSALPRPGLYAGSFGLRYGLRNQSLAYAGNTVNGTINNELGFSGRARLGDWLWSLEADRFRGAVALPELTSDGGATFSPETIEAMLSLGYVQPAFGGEIAPYLAAIYRDVHANSGGVAYTGTPLDWDQSRQTVGIGASYSKSLLPDLFGTCDFSYYPAFSAFASLARAPYQFSGLQGSQARFELATPIVPGIQVKLRFAHESWGANRYSEDANVLLLGISSHPGEVEP
ncbi:MAG TPA: carboxypeptidase-like regulatory domain-containing protein [Chroococcales cyanobacterium]|jgi:hypothetical protein